METNEILEEVKELLKTLRSERATMVEQVSTTNTNVRKMHEMVWEIFENQKRINKRLSAIEQMLEHRE